MDDLIHCILKQLTFRLKQDVRHKRVLCMNRRLRQDTFMVCLKHDRLMGNGSVHFLVTKIHQIYDIIIKSSFGLYFSTFNFNFSN